MVRVALVTGAGQGLGYQTAIDLARLGYEVIMSSRNIEHLEKGESITPFRLDVTNDQEVQECYAWILKTFGRLDVLVNNAAIYWERERGDFSIEGFKKTFDVNLLGAFRVTETVLPQMIEQDYGRVVNVSSGMGRFYKVEQESLFYSVSKLALNAYTLALAKKLPTSGNVLVNAVCPGWVRTRMGTDSAVRSLEEGVEGIIWAATLPKDGPSGQFFRDKTPLDWME